ncbi:MAG: ATP-dependent helicase HrpB [Wenzhouxiangella sp.]|nr:ATP-dependent helicase HrpB [Wenzhouxiangella sp.]
MSLPIHATLPKLLSCLEQHNTVLLQAPPGAGKTTAVPPALLDAPWRRDRRILMLEPRRLAARSAARFMARARGEALGQTVGYRVRLESRVSAATRIEIVTEGILTRMIQSDPELPGYAAVLFDEFHERSLNADLGLALVRESQQALREDLRILVMSATLDVEALSRLLDDAPVVRSEGRSHPVDVVYRAARPEQDLLTHVAACVRHSLHEDRGSILVFLPGASEIRRVAALLDDSLPGHVDLVPLYGDLSGDAQDAAIAPAPGDRRKIVLATSIAESSLTIEGIRVVIDAGQQRRARFDPNSGMTRLVTSRLSRASADQRSGRAGRLEAGRCYRLWSAAEQVSLAPFDPPEILEADLAPLVLELALWGIGKPEELSWLDPPPKPHWEQASELLKLLDALDASGVITEHGREMLEFGLNPRLAHLLIEGRRRGKDALAADLAALLSERDIMGQRSGCDLALRYRALHSTTAPTAHRGRIAQVRKLARSLGGGRQDQSDDDAGLGLLLALAFPDRIARARDRRGRFRLSNGRGAYVFEDDPLAGAAWLVAAELDGQARDARIFLAAELSETDIESVLAARIKAETVAEWDEQRGTVRALRRRMLGALVLEETELERPDPATLEAGLLDAVRRRGLEGLNWSESVQQWRARARTAHEFWPDDWPDFDDEALLAELEHWLAPLLAGKQRMSEVENIDWITALKSRLDYPQQRQLDELLPASLELPTGRQARLDYCADNGPVLAVKLQTLFGLSAHPHLAQGRLPVVIHLLSPAGRPLAVTADLESFWKNAYPHVRKDMRGRYPKHPWPEDPLSARPSEGVKHPRKR